MLGGKGEGGRKGRVEHLCCFLMRRRPPLEGSCHSGTLSSTVAVAVACLPDRGLLSPRSPGYRMPGRSNARHRGASGCCSASSKTVVPSCALVARSSPPPSTTTRPYVVSLHSSLLPCLAPPGSTVASFLSLLHTAAPRASLSSDRPLTADHIEWTACMPTMSCATTRMRSVSPSSETNFALR